jgi:DNA-binding response OmpR family regulator
VLLELQVEVSAGSTAQIKRLLAPGMDIDLVIFESRTTAQEHLEEIVTLVENQGCALLVIVDESSAESLKLPASASCDFVMHDAGRVECVARVRRLLGDRRTDDSAEIVTVDRMTINLATYQVTVGDDPIDFTYLEYALLAFLVKHPDHTFSRDTLLQNVWGFDYYGGSRTVDVHVRRIRAKLGPKLAQYLETVRGVGYLWKSR